MHVALDDVEPGMVLKTAAVNHQGQVLLPAGSEVATKHVTILRSWGVRDIDVEEPTSANLSGSLDSDEEAARIHARFRRVREDPVLEQIRNVILGRLGSES